LFRTREQFLKQRTEAINALQSHLYEFVYVAPEGIGYLPRLATVVEAPSSDSPLAREICRELLEQLAQLTTRINAMKKRIDAIASEGETSRRQQTMPGVGPISALAVETLRRRLSSSKGDTTLPPGSGSCRDRRRRAASSGSGRPRRWASSTFTAY
jgi:transposase